MFKNENEIIALGSIIFAHSSFTSFSKYQVLTKPQGSQAVFYNQLWEERIQNKSFDGGDMATSEAVFARLNHIIEQSVSTGPTSSECMDTNSPSFDKKMTPIPNVVSYDEGTNLDDFSMHASSDDDQLLEKSPADQRDHCNDNFIQTITPNFEIDEDFEIALELLRRAQTPDNMERFCDEPPDDIDITPAPITGLLTPIPVRVSSSGECYHNGTFVVSGYDDVQSPNKGKRSKKGDSGTKKKKPTSEEHGNMTRKFTRNDEILLIRGIITHGKKWKKIWDADHRLQHIMHSALKDRARSRRFKMLLERAESEPDLLENPAELCGDENQPEYNEGKKSTTPLNNDIDAEFRLDSFYGYESSAEASNIQEYPFYEGEMNQLSETAGPLKLDFEQPSSSFEEMKQDEVASEIDEYYASTKVSSTTSRQQKADGDTEKNSEKI